MIYVIGILSFIGACTIVFWGLRLLIFWSRLQDDHEEWETIDRNKRLYDRGLPVYGVPRDEWLARHRTPVLPEPDYDHFPKRFRAAAAEFDKPGGMNAPEFTKDLGNSPYSGQELWDERPVK